VRSTLQAVGVPEATINAILAVNASARLSALRAALAVVALVAVLALFFTRWIPSRQPGATGTAEPQETATED
jgi:hypothetical protein